MSLKVVPIDKSPSLAGMSAKLRDIAQKIEDGQINVSTAVVILRDGWSGPLSLYSLGDFIGVNDINGLLLRAATDKA